MSVRKLIKTVAAMLAAVMVFMMSSGFKSEVRADGNPDSVRQFVERLYRETLGREADEDGAADWTNRLLSGGSTGADVAFGFIFSDECRALTVENSDYVQVLYRAMLDRAPDGGAVSWEAALAIGMTKDRIIWGFTNSIEFTNLCATYLMNPGAIALSNYRDKNPGVTGFVSRCYVDCLGRPFDTLGLEGWCKLILTKKSTPEQVAYGFFFSKELTDKKISNLDFVNRLYMTLFGHPGDTAGINSWVALLNAGKTRATVFKGFTKSQEFDLLLESYGLKRK